MPSTQPFRYSKPTSAETDIMTRLNDYFSDAYEAILEEVVASAERTLAIRKLQECRMWTNVAVLEIGLPR